MPAATLRIMPARIISFWLMTSASAGTSRNVLMKYWLQRMGRGLYTRSRRGLVVARSRGWLLGCWVAEFLGVYDGGGARLSNQPHRETARARNLYFRPMSEILKFDRTP